MPLSIGEGTAAVELARETLDAHVSSRRVEPKPSLRGPFSELRGVFVTINLATPSPERLRGCIGFPYPVKPLAEAIQEATIAAASEDPRFPPVSEEELDRVVVEVSILTKPAEIDAPKKVELPSKVRIGVDGLIVSRFGQSGLLLPQVATEFGMDSSEFLSQACLKAGLLPDSWLEEDTEVKAFQAEVFTETTPRGKVVRVGQPGS